MTLTIPHDKGPSIAWQKLFADAPVQYYAGLPGTPFHTRFGPVYYRGRLDGSARVLVIGQDPASDETVAGRAFVGKAGQLAQSFLSRLGLTRSYLMFNTFLFGGQSGTLTPALATDATIAGYRNRLFDRAAASSSLSAIITFGNYAHTSALAWQGRGATPVIRLVHPTAQSGVAADWNAHFAAAAAAIAPDADGVVDPTPFDTAVDIPGFDIPRRDLPFGLPSWHGTGGGTRTQRVSGAFETQITWTAP